MVERRRLHRALDAAGGAALTLVAAPPGYGKTTAVRSWCATNETAFAWVTLDTGDNDPNRFWRYVATAVDRVRQGLGARALRRMNDPGSRLANPIDELMNGIAGYDRELVVVLDDMQHVTDPECLELIGYALERLPATARLIILTRVDPALKLAQLRARGDLVELRADQLAFTAEETHELLIERGGWNWRVRMSSSCASALRVGRRRCFSPATGCAVSTIHTRRRPSSTAITDSSPTTWVAR